MQYFVERLSADIDQRWDTCCAGLDTFLVNSNRAAADCHEHCHGTVSSQLLVLRAQMVAKSMHGSGVIFVSHSEVRLEWRRSRWSNTCQVWCVLASWVGVWLSMAWVHIFCLFVLCLGVPGSSRWPAAHVTVHWWWPALGKHQPVVGGFHSCTDWQKFRHQW